MAEETRAEQERKLITALEKDHYNIIMEKDKEIADLKEQLRTLKNDLSKEQLGRKHLERQLSQEREYREKVADKLAPHCEKGSYLWEIVLMLRIAPELLTTTNPTGKISNKGKSTSEKATTKTAPEGKEGEDG